MNKRSKLFFVSGLMSIVTFLFASGLFWSFSPVSIDKKFIEIPKNSSTKEISHILYHNDIIKSRLLFYLYVRITGLDRNLSYGRYLFEGEIGLNKVVKILLSGRIYLRKLTINEGLSLRRTLDAISKKGFGKRSVLDSLSKDSTFIKTLVKENVSTLEGFLYPETYFFPEDITEKELLTKIVGYFFKKVTTLNFLEQTLSFYQVLILASIVEMESVLIEEKGVIASVYLNRLNNNRRLQADPTIVYFLKESGINVTRVYYKDLKKESPFNTYLYRGLPPSPICSPSISSIQAVLKPKITDFLYFVASSDGSHVFSKTYKEHKMKIEKIKKSKNE